MLRAVRCWLFVPSVIATAVVLFLVTATSIAGDVTAGETAMSIDQLALKGKQLRAEIDAEYHRLKESKKLERNNDVTPIVTRYIPINTAFSEAKSILQAAGCTTGGVVTTRGHLFFSVRIGGGGLTFSSVSFAVDLAPRTPGDFTVVQAISGTILVEYV